MNPKGGVQTTTNHRKLMEIFLETDRDIRDNVLKDIEVSYVETICMTSPMCQVAKNAFLGFQINMSHLDYNGRGTGHKTMPKGSIKQTTRTRLTKDGKNCQLTTSEGLMNFFGLASCSVFDTNSTKFFTNIKYHGEGEVGKNTDRSVAVLLPKHLGPCCLNLTIR